MQNHLIEAQRKHSCLRNCGDCARQCRTGANRPADRSPMEREEGAAVVLRTRDLHAEAASGAFAERAGSFLTSVNVPIL